ncbi:hypothetical protein OC842_007519 [Tilletia horrida]|uniref:AMP-dependent synthetase/ligase domain-containing protein n=1 Tax=Tilletia horrida TaxID=155126 RepID=A0AAN6G3R6_9BASI|nr:hypothetical protein OC842_007519 [Tilletia horrida]
MGVSLIIDDTTLALLVVLIGALALNIYSARAATPLLHPLLLARQAEVSTVRQPSESAVYRNSNSPTGFDLAAKPRREISDVRSLIELGASGSEIEHARRILGHKSTVSNRQLLSDVQALAHALVDAGSGAGAANASTTIFIAGAGAHPSYAVLVGLLAATARGLNGAVQTVVLPPSNNSPAFASALRALPDAVLSKARAGGFALIASPTELESLQGAAEGSALQTLLGLTAASASSALATPPVVIIDDTVPSYSLAQATTSTLPLARTLSFSQLVNSAAASSNAPATADPDPPITRAGKLVAWFAGARSGAQSEYEWVPASNAVLVAGVTAQLSLFPADKIPSRTDEMLLALNDSSDQVRSAGASLSLDHPAGLALALTALYTGASFRAQTLASLRTETNEANVSSRVSLLYMPNALAAQLVRDLIKSPQSRQSAWNSSPLLGQHLRTSALRTLRCGTLPAPRKPVPSSLPPPSAAGLNMGNGHAAEVQAASESDVVEIRPLPPSYSAPASLGLAHIRSVILLTHTPAQAAAQSTLDTLRLECGCAVWQVYLPVHALAVQQQEAQGGGGGSRGADEGERQIGRWALVTAPVTAAHSLDLQAFAPFGDGKSAETVKGTHVGAPSVSLEVKLADVSEAAGEGRAGDLEGEVAFRGKTVALYAPLPSAAPAPATAAGPGAAGGGAGPPRPPVAPPSGHWVHAAQRGSWRSNGTLVLLP